VSNILQKCFLHARTWPIYTIKHQWLQENGKILASGRKISFFSSASHVHWYRAPTILAQTYVSNNFPCLFCRMLPFPLLVLVLLCKASVAVFCFPFN
jgi:hypothetical protein